MGKQGECRRCGHDSHVGRCMPVSPMTGRPVPGDPVCACEYEEREMDRQELEVIWEKVHPGLQCGTPLHGAIITEGIEAGGKDPEAIVAGLYTLAQDIEDLAGGIANEAHGEGTH